MNLELVNVVAGGGLDVEINLHSAFEQIGASEVKYEPEMAPGLQLQLKEATIMLFHSGKYHLTGADSFETAQEAAKELTEILKIVSGKKIKQENFEIRNLPYKGDFRREFDIDKIHSDYPEKTTFHSESRPALYFRSNACDGVLIIFRTGKCTVTGITSNKEAEYLVKEFKNGMAV